MLSKKARIKITNITDSYSFEQYKADNKQFVPLYTIDKEGKLHVITDKFDGTVPRDRKLVALVVDDDVQPKSVDVTAKQEQARVVADAHFDATTKAPGKRKGIELTEERTNDLTDDRTGSLESEVADNDNALINKGGSATTIKKQSNIHANNLSDGNADNSATTNNGKTKINSNTPKTKKGALDRNRLPDSNQSTDNSADNDINGKNTPTTKSSPPSNDKSNH